MRDVDLYGQILGIKSPWFVDKVDLKTSEGRVDIWLKHKSKVLWPCCVSLNFAFNRAKSR
jgi:transposase